MNWADLSKLIILLGLPAAEYILNKWESGGAPTATEFAELKGLAKQHGEDRMKAMLTAAGIPLESEEAEKLIALAKG